MKSLIKHILVFSNYSKTPMAMIPEKLPVSNGVKYYRDKTKIFLENLHLISLQYFQLRQFKISMSKCDTILE